MNRTATGWVFVAIQAVLLVALIAAPNRSDWATGGTVRAIGFAFLVGGFAVIGAAALTLGRSLTPTPVPVEHGELSTKGLYGIVRHPIYTGVLAIVAGLTIRSGSWISLVLAVLTFVFFTIKARWEEHQLADRYPGYKDYAEVTPRFVPRPWKKLSSSRSSSIG